MVNYAFILGHKHLLSIAELCNVIGKSGHIIDITKESLIATFDRELHDLQNSLNRLGGTVKIAHVISEIPADNSLIVPNISDYLINKYPNKKDKLSFGISAYSFPQKNEDILKKTLNKVKQKLINAGINNRFINKNFANLENAAIKGENLLEEGTEIIVINGTHRIFIAETNVIQDFENYSHRDYDRPERDPKLGMLPPKLAQIMINLGGLTKLESAPKNAPTLYDPFAGIGTILTEGLLLGYNIIGSDINEEVIEKARKNIDWTQREYNIKTAQTKLFQKDATALIKDDLTEKINLIVTESYLGPPLKKLPPLNVIKKNFSYIRETLYRFFNSMQVILEPKVPIIISFLAYKKDHDHIYLEGLIDQTKSMGFKIEPLISHNYFNKFNIKPPKREGIIYDRPDQVVCREIWKFTKH